MAQWTNIKHDLTMCRLQKADVTFKDTNRLKSKDAESKQKRAGVTAPVRGKAGLRTNAVTRDKEGHFTVIEGCSHWGDITVADTYAPKTGLPQRMKHRQKSGLRWAIQQ